MAKKPPKKSASRPAQVAGWRIERMLAGAEPFLKIGLQIGIVVIVISLGYILMATFRGAVAAPQNYPHLVDNLGDMGQIFALGSLVVAVCAGALFFHMQEMAVVLLLVGVAVRYGLPLGVTQLVISAGGQNNEATAAIGVGCATAGLAYIVVGALRLAVVIYDNVRESGGKLRGAATVGVAEKAPSVARKRPTVFSPCWELPFCRESIKKKCPAFIAKKRCWKFGRGCYCDESMIEAIVRGSTAGTRSYMQADISERKGPGPKKRRRTKAPCAKCYIYLEHQNLKHRNLSPLVFPVAVIASYLLWPLYQGYYNQASQAIVDTWSRFRLTSAAAGAAQSSAPTSGDTSAMMVFGIVIIAFLLLVYVTKFLEYVIFKLNW